MIAVAAGLILVVGRAPARAEPVDENKIGEEACAQLEKQVKVIDDKEQSARLTAIANRLGAVSARPEVKYSVKILDAPEINAFSIPGGHLYVTKGALEAVESEDELAAILAHEVAHNAAKHSLQSMKKESKAQAQVGLAVLAAVLAGQKVDAGNVMLMGGLLKEAVVNSYSRKFEAEADRLAVGYLIAAKYNPVAMLTVVEGLQRMEASRPRVEAGVLQSHPYPQDRVKAVAAQLKVLGIPINRRPVINTLVPKVEKSKQGEMEVGVLKLDQVTLLSVAPAQGATGEARAQAMADALHKALLENVQSYEFGAQGNEQQAAIIARNTAVITLLPEDAKLAGSTPRGLADSVLRNLEQAFWAEAVRRGY